MLKYNGEVDYELDPNDYTKKKDGTLSDYNNPNYEGNVMIGIPTVWMKTFEDSNYKYCIVSSEKIDSSFKAYAHTNNKGYVVPYIYVSAYSGSLYDNRLRSISTSEHILTNLKVNEQIQYAENNNINDNKIWYIDVLCDRMLINSLLILMGKSLDIKSVFGNGNIVPGNDILSYGTMNDKGLFYGTNTLTDGVKVFGIENYWGNEWYRTAGLINDHGTLKAKFTYSMNDESSCIGYNTTGEDYITLDGFTISGENGGYMTDSKMTEYGLLPITSDPDADIKYSSGIYYSNDDVTYSSFGGCINAGDKCSALCMSLLVDSEYTLYDVNTGLSCKP